jgi:ketosteroid isomerase-like protein
MKILSNPATWLGSVAAAPLLALSLLAVPVSAHENMTAPVYAPAKLTLSPQDSAQIVDIIGRMNQAIDASDYPTYSMFYAENGTIDSGFGPLVEGRSAIVATLNQSAPFITNKRHVATNIVLQGDGQTATAVYYLTVFERTASLSLAGTALITDVFRKTGDLWAVTSHTTRMDPATVQAMMAAMGSGGPQ